MHLAVVASVSLHSSADTSPCTGYEIHVNGIPQCTVRYRQLYSLHRQLCNQFPGVAIPSFPPKKILPLTDSQLDDRKMLLDKYLQLIGQNSTLCNSDLLIGFLATAQQETHGESRREVPLDVYLMNGCRIPLTAFSTDRSDKVLEKVCSQIRLPADLVKYFALYLIRENDFDDEIVILKRLEEFESPYVSQRTPDTPHRIFLRKSYWDPSYDAEVLSDRVGLDLLYAQTVAEIDAGWMIGSPEVMEKLSRLKENGKKREYMELAQTLRHYGCIVGGHGVAEWGCGGATRGSAKILLGSAGLSLLTQDGREACFKVTRMRCWRISRLDENSQPSNGHERNSTRDSEGAAMELSFEYLMNKEKLQWVTVISGRAMFMSVCLQSIVDELMNLKNFGGLHGSGRRSTVYRGTTKRNSLTYLCRDGSTQIITPSSSTDTLSSGNGDSATAGKEPFSIRRLSEKFSSVSFKSGKDCIESDAFEGIRDEDL